MVLILKLLLAIVTALIVAISYLGLTIDSVQTALHHVVAGIFATIAIVFYHCLALFYLNGTARAIKDAIAGHPDLAARFVPFTRAIRRRAYPPATLALVLTLVAAFAGGFAHSSLLGALGTRAELARQYVEGRDAGRDAPPELLAALDDDERARLDALGPKTGFATDDAYRAAVRQAVDFPVRRFPFWWLHLVILGAALVVNYKTFIQLLAIVSDNAVGIRELNAILEERDAAAVSNPAA